VGNQSFWVLEYKPGFARFRDIGQILWFGSYSLLRAYTLKNNKYKRNISTFSSHHPISYQGGGDYRGIYDIGLKRGF
jgi:hypothetical protein